MKQNSAEVISGSGGIATAALPPAEAEYPVDEDTSAVLFRLIAGTNYLAYVLELISTASRGVSITFGNRFELPYHAPELQLRRGKRPLHKAQEKIGRKISLQGGYGFGCSYKRRAVAGFHRCRNKDEGSKGAGLRRETHLRCKKIPSNAPLLLHFLHRYFEAIQVRQRVESLRCRLANNGLLLSRTYIKAVLPIHRLGLRCEVVGAVWLRKRPQAKRRSRGLSTNLPSCPHPLSRSPETHGVSSGTRQTTWTPTWCSWRIFARCQTPYPSMAIGPCWGGWNLLDWIPCQGRRRAQMTPPALLLSATAPVQASPTRSPAAVLARSRRFV